MYFSLCTEETEHELIMTPYETNILVTELLMCLNIFYYDITYFIVFSLLFSIYRAIKIINTGAA